MGALFTINEIKKAVNTLKDGKSCDIDNLNAELIKYGSESVF